MKFDSSKIWDLTKDNLLARVSNVEILQRYIPGQGVQYTRLCDFHKEDTPSMVVNLEKGLVTCFGCKFSTDGIGYVQKKYNLTFMEALKVIANDFGLMQHTTRVPLEVAGINPNKPKIIQAATIRIKDREWTQTDLIYWAQFGWTLELLKRFNIYPISHYWVNGMMFTIKKGELAYAFLEGDRFQIYQPFADKTKKWFSNTGNMMFGYNQLPKYGKICFITSAKKDIGTLTSLGFPAVAPSSEGAMLPVELYEDINNRFDKIVIYFNNDYQGLKAAHYMSEELGIPFIYNPLEFDEKDPSDFHKVHGDAQLLTLINKLLNELE